MEKGRKMQKLVEIITKTLLPKNKLSTGRELKISKVKMDSRIVEKDDLFFALNNGKKYIADVLEKGASLVICDDKEWENKDERVIVVEDTLETMQNLAREYRKALSVKIIGVVGSNGKTTTKDIIYSVLSAKYKCKKTEGNYNNHIGVPYTIFQIDENDEYAVVEMGMSGRGEIKALCETALPDYAAMTNIGDSHLEFLLNRDNVFAEKSEIKNYVSCENFVLYGDDFYLKNLNGIKLGFENNNNYIIENYKETPEGVEFEIENKKYCFKMNGKHNCINAAFGVVFGKIMGLGYDEITKGLAECAVTPMRFQKIEKNGIKYINDAYNASPISMKFSLDTLAEAYKGVPKIAVLADMGELGKDELKYHEEIIKYAVSLDIDRIILLGSLMSEGAKAVLNDEVLNNKVLNNKNEKLKEKIIIAETKDKIKEIIKRDFSDKVILLKGSNFNHLWEIME